MNIRSGVRGNITVRARETRITLEMREVKTGIAKQKREENREKKTILILL